VAIEITNRDQNHIVRSVPALIKTKQIFSLCVLENIFISNGHSLRQRGVFEDEFGARHTAAICCRIAGRFFGHDNAPFTFDFFFEQKRSVSVVPHDQHSLIQALLSAGRQKQLVDRVGIGGITVNIGAKTHAYGLKKIDQFPGREIVRSIEQHMLEKMGKATFIITLM